MTLHQRVTSCLFPRLEDTAFHKSMAKSALIEYTRSPGQEGLACYYINVRNYNESKYWWQKRLPYHFRGVMKGYEII